MKLYIEPADALPFKKDFEGDSMVIGRASTSDIPLADPFLSRHHARLFRQGEQVMIEDLKSRNGTELNGLRVEHPMPVHTGDEIKVSGSRIQIGEPSSQGDTTVDLGATILKPASELLRSVEVESRPDEVVGEDALRSYAARIKRMNEIHEALAGSISEEGLLALILDRAFEELEPEAGVIFLRQDDGSFERSMTRSAKGLTDDEEIPLSRSLVEEVCVKGMAAVVIDAATDERFAEAQSIIMSGLRSLVAAPLLDGADSLGMIVLSSKAAKREFDEEDMQFLVSMASIAALKIRNVSLAHEAAQRKKLEEDLALARRIQESLLPSSLPDFSGFELFARNVPSRGVSGDYYNVQLRADGRECVVFIADVSGKGIPASILTASLEALSAGPIEDGHKTDDICTVLSRRLYRRSPPEKYATALLAVIDRETGEAVFTNAGHNPGLLVRTDGSTQELGSSGMPLGLVETGDYSQSRIVFDPGDLLCLYTDGFTEAENHEDEEFGFERFTEVAVAKRAEPLEEIAQALSREIAQFTRGVPPADDQTVVLVRRSFS